MKLRRFLYAPWVAGLLVLCAVAPAILGADARVVSHRGITLKADGFMAAGSFAITMAVIAVVLAIALAFPSRKRRKRNPRVDQWVSTGAAIVVYALTVWFLADPVGEPTSAPILVASGVIAAAALVATVAIARAD